MLTRPRIRPDYATLFLVLGGIFLRLQHYLQNRSLWHDECWPAVSIAGRSLRDIILQVPFVDEWPLLPLGMSVPQKLATIFWGNHEYALRLFPFLWGVLAVVLFYQLLKHYSLLTQLVALSFFALCERFIYFSAEAKQYSGDVLTAVVLYWFWEQIRREGYPVCRLWSLGVLGFAGLWFSQTAVFLLAGLGAADLCAALREKGRVRFRDLLKPWLLWLAGFGGVYFHVFRKLSGNDTIYGMWEANFLPRPVLSRESLEWTFSKIIGIFDSSLDLTLPVLAAGIFLYGCVRMFRSDRVRMVAYLAPLVLTFFAAALWVYPFHGRLILFAMPGVIVVLTSGIMGFLDKRQSLLKVLGLVVFAVLIFHPLRTAFVNLTGSWEFEDNRAVMKYYREHFQEGDSLALNRSAQFPYWYYTGSLDIDIRTSKPVTGRTDEGLITGYRVLEFQDDVRLIGKMPLLAFRDGIYVFDENGHFQRNVYLKDTTQYYMIPGQEFNFLPEGRMWILLSHFDLNTKKYLLYLLDKHGQRLQSLEKEGAAIFLYELPPNKGEGSNL